LNENNKNFDICYFLPFCALFTLGSEGRIHSYRLQRLTVLRGDLDQGLQLNGHISKIRCLAGRKCKKKSFETKIKVIFYLRVLKAVKTLLLSILAAFQRFLFMSTGFGKIVQINGNLSKINNNGQAVETQHLSW
jgi:hypothetical protein